MINPETRRRLGEVMLQILGNPVARRRLEKWHRAERNRRIRIRTRHANLIRTAAILL